MPGFRFDTKAVTLTKSEQKIIDYIYNNIAFIPFYSIGQLAEQLDVSIATLSRFVKHLGYENFKELKTAIMEHENSSPASKLSSTLSNPELESMSQLLLNDVEFILKTKEYVSEGEVKKAVNVIAESERIYFFGKGASKGLAEYFCFRLNRFLKYTRVLKSSGSELFEELINIRPEDLVVIFGFHTLPAEAKILLDYKKEAGYTTLLFTDKLYNETRQLGDINLYVYRGEPKQYHSMAAPTALIDGLVIQTAKQLKDSSIQSLDELYRLKEKYAAEIPR